MPVERMARRRVDYADDFQWYGDLVSPFPRWASTSAKAMSVGTAFVSGLLAPVGGTATKVRVMSNVAAAGTGQVQIGVYSGASPSALAQRATVTALTAVAATTFYELTLSAAVTWGDGDFLYIDILPTGFSTCPTFQSSGGGGGPSAFLCPVGSRKPQGTLGSQSALPSTIDVSGYSSTGSAHWWALAA